MSLRRRVLLGCLAVALVLVGGDIVLARTFHSFLLGRVDRQLELAVGRVGFRGDFGRRGFPGAAAGTNTPSGGLSDYFIERLDADGTVLAQILPGLRGDEAPPALTIATLQSHTTDPGDAYRPFTARAAHGGPAYRVVSVGEPDGGVLVTALSLHEMNGTYHRMLLVELLATALVLAALAAVAIWVLRLGVRPLAAMAGTAQAIAAGDLSQRVPPVDEGTEAGQLALALNGMLERIEEAFDERAASEQRLRRFVADASHELRTPLTSIRGYTELWRQGGLRDRRELADAMRRVEQEAERMGLLVDDLLLLARLDQGRPLEQAPVDLEAVVHDAVRDARAVEPDRPIDFTAQPVTVTGDENRLRQVVANLLANVRTHTPAGTPVHVGLRTDGDGAVIEVADEGPGMDAETSAHVFERFYRADTARARARGGTGLGLSIVAAVAEAHGGQASVVSAPGQGARFRVELPLTPPAPATPPETAPTGDTAAPVAAYVTDSSS